MPPKPLTDCTGTGQRYTPTRVPRCPECARPASAIGPPSADGAVPAHSPHPADQRRTARR